MAPIRYRVSVSDAHTHCYQIRCEVAVAPGPQIFRLPNWLRGSYLLRYFAKHVTWLRATRDGRPTPIERLDKASFSVAGSGSLIIEYETYAFDSSVRKAYLDARRGFFNGSSLFYLPEGFADAGFELEIARPDPAVCAGWKLATTMAPLDIDADGFGVYGARSYEELIDHPVEMGAFQRVDFDVEGIPHAYTFAGRCSFDGARLAEDTRRICEAQRAMFGHQPKLDQYLFLTQVTPNGYGGLEHRASSALVTARDALPRPGETALRKGYRGFLGLVSHEYFHLWNVKRMTPQPFAESALDAEAYSRDLWVYEGVTSYYDDIMLLRAGILDAPAYLDLLAEAATRLQRPPGRQIQTLADASFEAWIKYYQPDENTPNQAVNYYVKGSLLALCLDLRLRRDSAISLDDVMRALWTRFGATGLAVPEAEIERVAAELSGLELTAFFNRGLRSTEELPLVELLADFGVEAKLRPMHGAGDEGGRAEFSLKPSAWIGALIRADGCIAQVLSGSPAERAGLASGDLVVALDGLRVTGSNWNKALDAVTINCPVAIHFFRGDELLCVELTPQAAPLNTWTLSLAKAPLSDQVLQRRLALLGRSAAG